MAYIISLLKQIKCVIDSPLIDTIKKLQKLEHLRNLIKREIDLRVWDKESREPRTVSEANSCHFSALQFPRSQVKRANNRIPVR